jgi:cytochrome c553
MGRRFTVLLGAFLLVAASAPALGQRVIDTIAERTQPCVACHGKEGRATSAGYFPRIAGKPAGYLFNQLVNFREGRRNNAAMTYLVEHLADAYLQEIAGHFASLSLPYPPPQQAVASSQVLGHGERLVRAGDPDRNIPACVSCHGEALTGVLPAVPGLLGLPRDYLIGQLGSWRSGARRAAAPDCMADITARLSSEDIGAVAAWLASQHVPPDSRPAAALPRPAGMPCGSGFDSDR